MSQILINALTIQEINSALLRVQRSIKNNQAALPTNVNKIVSSGSSTIGGKYDDTAILAQINALSASLSQALLSVDKLDERVTDNEENIQTNANNIASLQSLLSNINFTYDSETNTIHFTDVNGDTTDIPLIDTTYDFAFDPNTHKLSVENNLTGETVFDSVVDTTYNFSFDTNTHKLTIHNNMSNTDVFDGVVDTVYSFTWNNGTLTITDNRSANPIATINFDNRYYTEDEIQALVLDLIPSQASAENQLADKAFVNSSIETSTATFRGTFDSVAELNEYSGPVDNNDYAFVKTLDVQSGLYQYDRYKWVAGNPGRWVYEYTINSSGFTAEQLAALNSGITSSLVAKITDVYNCSVQINQNGTCKGSFTLNQNSNATISLTDQLVKQTQLTSSSTEADRNLLIQGSGTANNACTCIYVSCACPLTYNHKTGIIKSMNTDNWGSVYSGNTYSTGYFLLAQLIGSAATGNHDVTLYGTTFKNAANIDYPTTFRVYIRGKCDTVNATSFKVDNEYNDIFATYEVDTTNHKFTLRLYGCINAYYTKYNTQISYTTSGDVSTRISTGCGCLTFPNTYFASLPNTETLITKTPLTVMNSTCFGGCTYAQACTDIRTGLCSHDCLVKLSLLYSNTDRRILFSAQGNGCVCPVYASNGVPFTYNACCGCLKIGDFSCNCCEQVYFRHNTGLIRSGPKGTQTNGFVVYKENNCLDNCSIGVGIGSGNINRGFFDYCKASETATTPTFRWLQYWDGTKEIHALPIWGELGADNKVVYSCVLTTPYNTRRYALVCFDKACCGNPSNSSACFEVDIYTSKYYIWIDVASNAACMRTYWVNNGVNPNRSAYGSFCTALPDTTANGNCFWITYSNCRAPVIKSARKLSIICNTTTAPSGITFTAPTNCNSYIDVYCGTTCVCTLQGPASLCLGSNAFNSTAFCSHDCLVKNVALCTCADRNILQAACDVTANSICPVYYSCGCSLTFNACCGCLKTPYLMLGTGSATSDAGIIYGRGTCATCPVIRFLNNTNSADGNGYLIYSGGVGIVGAGEGAGKVWCSINGSTNLYGACAGQESLYLTSDGSIYFYTNTQCDDTSTWHCSYIDSIGNYYGNAVIGNSYLRTPLLMGMGVAGTPSTSDCVIIRACCTDCNCTVTTRNWTFCGCDGLLYSNGFRTNCNGVPISYPKASTTYVLLGCIKQTQLDNEYQIGFYVSGVNVVNNGVLKWIGSNSGVQGQNNIEIKLSNYCNGSYGITGIGFIKTANAWNCWTCVVLRICNQHTSCAYCWNTGVYKNQIGVRGGWAENFTCLGSTAPTFDCFIDIPTECRNFTYRNGCVCIDGDFNAPLIHTKCIYSVYPAKNTSQPLTFYARCCNASAIQTATMTFNPTGLLCVCRINNNGYSQKWQQTINLSSQSANCFYPITWASNGTFETDIEIQSPSGSGSLAYNQNYIHFYERANGWSDTPKTVYVQTLSRFDSSENLFGCIGYGTGSSAYSVIWLRGGRSYTANANVVLTTNTSNVTCGDTSRSPSTYTVGTSLCGGTNTCVGVFANATTNAGTFSNQNTYGAFYNRDGCAYILKCEVDGCGYLSDISINVYCGTTCKCTISNNGTLTLGSNAFNSTAFCSHDCLVKLADVSSDADRAILQTGNAFTAGCIACVYKSAGKCFTFNASSGVLKVGCRACNSCGCIEVMGGTTGGWFCTYNCDSTSYSMTSGSTYYIKIGTITNTWQINSTDITIAVCGNSTVDKVRIHWVPSMACDAGTRDAITIDQANYNSPSGIKCVGWKRTGTGWNNGNDIYLVFQAPATYNYIFSLYRNQLGGWSTGFSCSTTAPGLTCSICTKPNGARAFHWLNGDTCIESAQDWKQIGSFTGTRSCNRYYMRLGSFHNVNPETCIKVVLCDTSHCSTVYISTKGTCLDCGNWTYQIDNESGDSIIVDSLQLQCNSTDSNAYLGILDCCSTGTICMDIYQKGSDLGFNPLVSTTSRYTNTLSGYSPISITGKNIYGYTNFNNINANRVDSYVFTTTSALKCKCDITKPSRRALDIIDSLDIVEYRYKNEDKSEPKHIGIIADYTDELLSGKTHDQLRLADAVGLLLQAVKELKEERE